MLARLFSVFSFTRSRAEPRKPDSAAYKRGYEMAIKDRGNMMNPYPAGTQEHADWLEGQSIAQSDGQW